MRKLLLYLLISLLLPSVCFGAAATMYVTPSGAGAKDGTSWATAFGYAEWETDVEGATEAGDKYYIAGGTYTFTSAMSPYASGTSNAPIYFIGVKSSTTAEPPTASDYAYGDDRPLWAKSGNEFNPSSKANLFLANIRETDAAYRGFQLNQSIAVNCKATSTNASEGAFNCYYSACINIEASNSKSGGRGVQLPGGALINSYVHDSPVGVYVDSNNYFSVIANTVIDTSTTKAIDVDIKDYQGKLIINNTLYSGGTGIDFGTGTSGANAGPVVAVNNLIDNFTTGMALSASAGFAYSNFNVLSNNTTDYSNVTQGPNDVVADVSMTDPANGDFTLPDSSSAEGVGAPNGTNIGLTGDYNWNIGIDQTDTQSGGGGSVTTGWGYAL